MNESLQLWNGKKVVGGNKHFSYIYSFIYQISLFVIKLTSKKAILSETERFIKLWQADESIGEIQVLFRKVKY